jgi:hypothetical protein
MASLAVSRDDSAILHIHDETLVLTWCRQICAHNGACDGQGAVGAKLGDRFRLIDGKGGKDHIVEMMPKGLGV